MVLQYRLECFFWTEMIHRMMALFIYYYYGINCGIIILYWCGRGRFSFFSQVICNSLRVVHTLWELPRSSLPLPILHRDGLGHYFLIRRHQIKTPQLSKKMLLLYVIPENNIEFGINGIKHNWLYSVKF